MTTASSAKSSTAKTAKKATPPAAEKVTQTAPVVPVPDAPAAPDATTVIDTITDADGNAIAEVTETTDGADAEAAPEAKILPDTARLDPPDPIVPVPVAPDGFSVSALLPPVLSDPDAGGPTPFLYDEATGVAPDINTVFTPITEVSTVLICNVRLIERGYVGPHYMPTDRLVLARGAQVDAAQAMAILGVLQEQAAADTAAVTDGGEL